jgi:hypothetical protein
MGRGRVALGHDGRWGCGGWALRGRSVGDLGPEYGALSAFAS